MSSYAGSERAVVAAPPQACFDAFLDFESMPDWQRSLRSAEVLERDEQGRGTVVEYAVDAKVKTVRYTLRLDYDAPHRIGSTYVDGDFRSFSAEWRFGERADGGTDVELEAEIDPGRFVPGPLRNALRDVVLARAVGDLKAHLER